MKTSISDAYQKTKQTIGNTFTNIKNSFKKPETKKPDVPPSSQGNEGTDLSGGDNSGSSNANPGRNDGSSFGGSDNTGALPDVNGANNGGSSGFDDNNNGSSGVIGNNPSATSNVGDNTGNQQGSLTDSEVEQLIDVRFRNKSPKKN